MGSMAGMRVAMIAMCTSMRVYARSSAVAIDDLSCAATQLCVRVCALYVCAVAVCVRVSVVDAEVEDF